MRVDPLPRSSLKQVAMAAIAWLVLLPGTADAVHIGLGSADGVRGEKVTVEIHMDAGDQEVSGVEYGIVFEPSLLEFDPADCEINPDISSAPAVCKESPPLGPCKDLLVGPTLECGAELCFEPIDDEDEGGCFRVDCEDFDGQFVRVRMVVLALNTLWPIPSGPLNSCKFTVREDAGRSATLHLVTVGASDPKSRRLNTTGNNGLIRIPTLPPMPTVAVPTVTASASPTSSATATPSATASRTETAQPTEGPPTAESTPPSPSETAMVQSTAQVGSSTDGDGCAIDRAGNGPGFAWASVLMILLILYRRRVC